jgi:hypothetical protein
VTTDLSQPQPQAGPQTGPLPRSGGRGRWLALGVVGVLVAVATGVGVGEAILDGEKKPVVQAAPAAQAAAPSFGSNADGSHFGSLGDLLLPIPGGAGPGPDDRTFGNDTVLTPAQYQPFFDEDFGYLAGADRSRLSGLLDLGDLKGAALQTYQVTDQLDVEIGLFQVSPARVMAGPAIVQELANATGGYTGTVSVTGFPKARCYEPPLAQASEQLDYMDCEAVVGDLLVTVEAYGAAPMDSSVVTGLLQQQLTRLGTPEAQT